MKNSWGRLTKPEHRLFFFNDPDRLKEVMQDSLPGLPFGVGRSYGDVCLNPKGNLWDCAGMNKFLSFDRQQGILHCEAGTLLRDIQRLVVPEGWILPVSPGTQLVTVGGAIANDVHGKSHHRQGTFGNHIRKFRLLRTDGEMIECSPIAEPEWFAATVGGMGLTGVILDAEIKLQKITGPWIESETIPFSSLEEFFILNEESEQDWEYTVSWIDCLNSGKGLFMRGNHSEQSGGREPGGLSLTMPFTPPVSLVNKISLRLFNTAYYAVNKRKKGKFITHYQPFFYPLDKLHEWNRMYGPRGFFQYQIVVPKDDGRKSIATVLKTIERSGEGSFLAVLKTFGDKEPVGLMSFPRPGITLALDFPNKGRTTMELFDELNNIVADAGGRLYGAKDACMPIELFKKGYPQLETFLQYRDPGITSGLSRRLMGS